MAGQLTVLYDADCGICTHTARALARLDWRRRLRLISLQGAALPGQPDATVLGDALHAVDDQGRWFAGVHAAIEVARRVPLLRPVGAAARLPLVTPILDVLYRTVANNRQRLSRMLGLRACRVPERRV